MRGPRSAARRQHILATTRDLFVKRGFHQTGMAQIASSSGIAVGRSIGTLPTRRRSLRHLRSRPC
ncbi:TetR/AcrR family transcriptional regulator [Sphingobium herbicidovorans]|uniref:TetR/AcrR family transcriptional regulator n=1 Tax=Sphingobium herbicidovorans TaxID=76947 RepID=UPI001F29BBD6|nr:helix-turn-helix domain-containing protein [Sphingobium herbicidovorans]